jgi:DNA-binding SARP family transcriptional activator
MIELRTLGALQLRGPPRRDYDAVLAQPKRLALLVYLAVAHRGGLARRDTLVGLFWPALDDDHARSALRQSLTFLRRTLGDDVLARRGAEDIGVCAAALETDAVLFDRAYDAGDFTAALQLYRGDLLEGLFASDIAPELERWIEDERARLRHRAVDAAWKLVTRCEAAGNQELALEHARHAVALSPQDERGLRRLMTLLDRADDYDEAVHAYDTFARRLADDLDVNPALETTALMTRVRSHIGGAPIDRTTARAIAKPSSPPPDDVPTETPERRSSASKLVPAAIAIVLLAMSGAIVLARSRRDASATVAPARSAPAPSTRSLVARDLYLKARVAIQQGTLASLKTASDYLQEAVRADSAFAEGYALLALANVYMPLFGEVPPNDAYPRAQAAAVRALELDGSLAEGPLALAHVSAYFYWDWKEADRLFRRALERAPDDERTHVSYGDFLSSAGRLPESLAEYERAKALDPTSTRAMNNLARRLIWMGQYDRARAELDAALKLDPGFARAHRTRGVLYVATGRYDDAIAELSQARDLAAGRPFDLSALAYAYTLAGRTDEARRILDALEARATREYVPPYAIATVHASLGQKDEAFAWLDRAIDAHDSTMSFTILYETMLDPVRKDPRFAVVLRRMRLGA